MADQQHQGPAGSPTSEKEKLGFDPHDPHGFHEGEEHGHHILSMRMLVVILALLLALTGLTVGSAQAEIIIAEELGISIPQWVNVTIAMTIATVKAILVVAFFMQLYYDTKLNTMILLFCLLTFGLFIGFTSIDMGNRDRIYSWKDGQHTPGGTGGLGLERGAFDSDRNPRRTTVTGPDGEDTGRTRRASEEVAGAITDYSADPDVARTRIDADVLERLERYQERRRAQRPAASPNRVTDLSSPRLFAPPDDEDGDGNN
ncbi:MAG: cytochrome C oxidase subunit IV family protein [Phycisphaerales bacterium]|nr:cytochrome C oxidase subunit IV family protein [Phycisphaerales bacterium]